MYNIKSSLFIDGKEISQERRNKKKKKTK